MIKSAWKGRTDMVVYLFNFNTCQDLALLEIGDQQCSPLYSFGPYIRNEYIFHYVVSGKGVVMLQLSGEKDRIFSPKRLKSRREKVFCWSRIPRICTVLMRTTHGIISGSYSPA